VAQISPNGDILALSPLGDQYAGTKLVEDNKGELWVNGMGVHSVRRAGKQIVLGEAQHLKWNGSEPVLELDAEYDKQRDRLWTCGPYGLSVRQGQTWRDITSKDGMLLDFCISLAVLDNGDAWYGYGYTSNAFDRLRLGPSGEVNIQHFNPEFPGSANHFFDVDQRGWLWRGAVDGIYVATPEKAAANEWVRIEEADGLVYDSGNQQSFYSDPDGSVWFATGNAIVHFSPTQDFLQSATVPKVSISGFSLDGGAPKLSETLAGIPHSSGITANLGSLYFDHRSNLRVRYRLLPEQKDWKEESNLELRLGKLGWGQHTLEVQARVGLGPWSSAATQAFWVQRPLWLSWPAALGFVAIAVAAGFGVRKWDSRRKALAKSLPELTPWRLAVLLPEVQDLVGKQLDSRYEVGELLARGGFANVMDGFDRKEKRRCAIKVFRNEVGKNESMQKRFEQEVSALQQVRHPHVVSIYAHGTLASGTPFLVMEFVEGKSLREILSDGPVSPARAARILRQLGEALEAIHQKGICHRDVKPENVMIRNPETPGEEAVLIDFSISLVKEADETLHGLSRAAGTFEYMAPEQAIGYARPSSDIYSLAKLLVEMLTGERLAALLPNASMDLPARVREVLTKLPVSFSEVSVQLISMALEFDPSRRPENAAAFVACIVQDLEQAQMKV
jgi:tRNA A-37 threonylcarbamoyl transferase component Bud32